MKHWRRCAYIYAWHIVGNGSPRANTNMQPQWSLKSGDCWVDGKRKPAGNNILVYTSSERKLSREYCDVQRFMPADVGGKTHNGCSACNRNNPNNNFNNNNGFRVAVPTLLARAVSQPELSGGYACRVEVRNGGVLSRPRYQRMLVAGQITTGRAPSVYPWGAAILP